LDFARYYDLSSSRLQEHYHRCNMFERYPSAECCCVKVNLRKLQHGIVVRQLVRHLDESGADGYNRRRFSSSLHTNDLAQRMDNLNKVSLRGHHRIDVLVGHGRLVDDVRVLAALDALSRFFVVGKREPALGLGS